MDLNSILLGWYIWCNFNRERNNKGVNVRIYEKVLHHGGEFQVPGIYDLYGSGVNIDVPYHVKPVG